MTDYWEGEAQELERENARLLETADALAYALAPFTQLGPEHPDMPLRIEQAEKLLADYWKERDRP